MQRLSLLVWVLLCVLVACSNTTNSNNPDESGGDLDTLSEDEIDKTDGGDRDEESDLVENGDLDTDLPEDEIDKTDGGDRDEESDLAENGDLDTDLPEDEIDKTDGGDRDEESDLAENGDLDTDLPEDEISEWSPDHCDWSDHCLSKSFCEPVLWPEAQCSSEDHDYRDLYPCPDSYRCDGNACLCVPDECIGQDCPSYACILFEGEQECRCRPQYYPSGTRCYYDGDGDWDYELEPDTAETDFVEDFETESGETELEP